MKQINILLVDDHDVVREGIAMIISGNHKFRIVANASGGEPALAILSNRNDIDLVSTDISMDGMDGIQLAREISNNYPGIKIMALTMIKESYYIKKMFEAGATGYVLKNSGQEQLFNALEKVSKGELYWSDEAADTIMNFIARKSKKATSSLFREGVLTSPETGVLELMLRELDNREIADKLSISQETVEVHKKKLLDKTGTKHPAGLALYAIKSGFFEIDQT